MKSLLHILLVLITGTLFANPSATKVDFINGSLRLAQQKAGQEGKLVFVEFGAQWCMPCRFMEENTFKDKDVVQYISDNYVPVKIDIDDFDGFAYKQKYNVETLPTFLIFNSEGKVVDRHEQSMAPSNLLNVLRQNDTDRNRLVIAGTLSAFEIEQKLHEAEKARLNVNPYDTKYEETVIVAQIEQSEDSSPTASLEGPIIQESLVDITTIGEMLAEDQPSASVSQTEETAFETDGELLWEEDYKMKEPAPDHRESMVSTNEKLLEVSTPKVTFYSVRVGTFANKRSMEDYVKATSAIFVEDTHIFQNNADGLSSYEVCLGAFASKTSASHYIDRLGLLNISGEIKVVQQ